MRESIIRDLSRSEMMDLKDESSKSRRAMDIELEYKKKIVE
jgi:hypothetical protein